MSSLGSISLTGVASRRGYYSFPATMETVDDLDELAQSGKRILRGTRNYLSRTERISNSEAKVQGYLRLHNGARPVLTKIYTRECYAMRRPFIGLTKHGDRLFVDTRPGEFLSIWGCLQPANGW